MKDSSGRWHNSVEEAKPDVVSNERMVSDLYEKLIKKFVVWAEARSDIRMAVIIGSRARTDHAADEWADLDLLMVTTDPEHYVATSEWTAEMGRPMITFIEETAGEDEQERRVLYEGMLDVDYAVFPIAKIRQLISSKNDSSVPAKTALIMANAVGRGTRVILDKDGLAKKIEAILIGTKQPFPQPPSQNEFDDVVSDFLYHCVWTAKHVLRGELWWALTCLNCRLAQLQLRMTEWQAQASHGKGYDTWFRGRFLEEWADPNVKEGLKTVYSHYDRRDAVAALEASMNLFRETAIRTANKLNLQYPNDADKEITKWVRFCL